MRLDTTLESRAYRAAERKKRGIKRQIRLGNYDTPQRFGIAADRLIYGMTLPAVMDDGHVADVARQCERGIDWNAIGKQMREYHESPGVVFDPERKFTPRRERPTRDEAELIREAFDRDNTGDRFDLCD